MDREIESRWEGLMAAMVLARGDEKAKPFVSYGRTIVDLVETDDYEGARETRKEFMDAIAPTLVEHGLTDYFRNYIEKMDELVDALPKD